VKKVFILGFGRSGTTWLSDIISKSLNGLVLFEPLHPSVDEVISRNFAYSMEPDHRLRKFLEVVLTKNVRRDWLLRNHLPDTIQNTSNEIKKEIWDSCKIVGMKFIRANFMIDWFKDNFDCEIIYIKRDIYSVISSIIKRNFWEFGWENTYNLFRSGVEKKIDFKIYFKYIQQIASMWCATEVLRSKRNDILTINYEDLYYEPYTKVGEILDFIGMSETSVHPSFIYTPSNVSLMEISSHKKLELNTFRQNLFEEDIEEINIVLRCYGLI
jgi:hypothetical protein